MALSYSLRMASDLNWAQAKRLLAERLPAEMSSDGHFVYKPDILISGSDMQRLGIEVTEEDFHFTPNLSVGFRLQHDADAEQFYPLMLRASMLLLEHGRDAVLLFNGEIIVFQRLGGNLVFNTNYGLGVESEEELLRKEVHIPYERRPLISPALVKK